MNKQIALLSLVTATIVATVLTACSRTQAQPTTAEKLERGKYLVESVGLCADCHTPRNPDGSFDMSRWLAGSPLGFAPTVPIPVWADVAPPLAGSINGMSDEEALRFFETGINRLGQLPRPPMPHYRFTHSDAESVVIFLRSLGEKSRN